MLTRRLSPSSESPVESPFTISTVEPALEIAAVESISDPITWYVRMSERVSVSSSNAVIVSSPSRAKASSVGANTVNELSMSLSVTSNPVASKAVTSVVKLPFATATSTMLIGSGSGSGVGAGLWFSVPLPHPCNATTAAKRKALSFFIVITHVLLVKLNYWPAPFA